MADELAGRTALITDILGLSFAPGAQAHGTGGGGAGKVSFHDLSITKVLDKSSVTLQQACASGKHFPKVTLVVRKAGGQPYLEYTLSDVLVASYQLESVGGGDKPPLEQITLNFGALKIKYTQQK